MFQDDRILGFFFLSAQLYIYNYKACIYLVKIIKALKSEDKNLRIHKEVESLQTKV